MKQHFFANCIVLSVRPLLFMVWMGFPPIYRGLDIVTAEETCCPAHDPSFLPASAQLRNPRRSEILLRLLRLGSDARLSKRSDIDCGEVGDET